MVVSVGTPLTVTVLLYIVESPRFQFGHESVSGPPPLQLLPQDASRTASERITTAAIINFFVLIRTSLFLISDCASSSPRPSVLFLPFQQLPRCVQYLPKLVNVGECLLAHAQAQAGFFPFLADLLQNSHKFFGIVFFLPVNTDDVVVHRRSFVESFATKASPIKSFGDWLRHEVL